jgi:arylsulfatase A-like enzyme
LGCYRKTLPTELAYVWGENIAVETPNIDWLSDEGALCTSFYATSPVCSPSRASFVTGMYPQNTKVVTNNIPMDGDLETFASVLKRNGYMTGYAGKWHLDGLEKPQWEPKRTFGFTDNRYMFNRGHWKQLMDTEAGPRVAARDKSSNATYGIEGANSQNFTTDFLTDKTIEFIRQNKGQPFCYMLSYPDPHGPNTVRSPYDTMYNHHDFQVPHTNGKSEENLPTWAKKANKTISKNGMSKYFGMVKCIDDNVGRIIELLEKENILKNTIVVFTSDHGDLCGEHGRDNKGVPYEASAKIPFLLYYPAKVQANTVINEALTCVDFMPTILGLMNITDAPKVQGRNASILFEANSSKDDWEDIAFFRGHGQRVERTDINWLGAVTDRYKLIYAPNDVPWLIDLEKDPDELVNQFGNSEYREVVKELSGKIVEYGRKNSDPRTEMEEFRIELEVAMQ